jgi:hypothetical protein
LVGNTTLAGLIPTTLGVAAVLVTKILERLGQAEMVVAETAQMV